MGEAIAARVLRDGVVIGTESRPAGSALSVDEWNSISPSVQNALVNNLYVRRVFGDEADETLRVLLARIETLEAKVAEIENAVVATLEETE